MPMLLSFSLTGSLQARDRTKAARMVPRFLVIFFISTLLHVIHGLRPGTTPIIVQQEILVVGRKNLLECEVLTDKAPPSGHFPLTWTIGHAKLRATGETTGTWHSFASGGNEVLTRYTSEYEFTVTNSNQGENITCTATFADGTHHSTSLTMHVYNSTLCDKHPCKTGGYCDTRPATPNKYTCTYPNPHPESNPCQTRNVCGHGASCTFDPEEVTEFACTVTSRDFQVLIG